MNKPGEVIKPDDIKTVEGKGLPFHKQSFKFGNLYVVFKVSFPTSVAAPALTQISGALAGMKKKEDDTEMEVSETLKLTAYSEAQRNTHATGGQEAGSDEEEEDDGHQGQQKV